MASWLIIMLVFYLIYAFVFSGFGKPKEMAYSDMVNAIKKEEITSIYINGRNAEVTLADSSQYKVILPSLETLQNDCGEEINAQMSTGKLRQAAKGNGIPWSSVLNIGVSVLILVVFIFMFKRGGPGAVNGFTKNLSKINIGKSVKFTDVAGAVEEKAELEEVVSFLKNPQKFTDLGARIPKGILLVGPPGTGKTLLAKAVAGEADVPFFSMSGSDFVELYVGVGASRVRDLFEQAKRHKPCIIFIDEIDAVGRKRGAGMGGGHDEREQTLNQLLVEMDGFGENEGVIMIAATNRPDILDPALLRPGRFDRQVVVNLPDVKGREEILQVHSKKKPMDDRVDFQKIARNTVGYSGADLENLMNEAAILAARRNGRAITEKDIDEANLKVIMGSEKRSRKVTDKDKKLTAYHEAGHAILGKAIQKDMAIHKVTIIPRGRAGGFTMSTPVEDKSYQSKNEMLDEIVVLLGGRAAEDIWLDDISTGASNDIERATSIARQMVKKYGMSSELGVVSYDEGGEVFIGRDFGHSKNYSEKTAAMIDDAVTSLLNKKYEEAKTLLKEHKHQLEAVAEELIVKETLDGEEFDRIYNEADALGNTMLKEEETNGTGD
ncbi:MAG: ATP-dependent zinc metalloprotease FtsH [bacterium]|nr:ATP-dependent zinc metalloprotease FtsH [bacterium]